MDHPPEFFVVNPDVQYDCIPHPIFIMFNVVLILITLIHISYICTDSNTRCGITCGNNPKPIDV